MVFGSLTIHSPAILRAEKRNKIIAVNGEQINYFNDLPAKRVLFLSRISISRDEKEQTIIYLPGSG